MLVWASRGRRDASRDAWCDALLRRLIHVDPPYTPTHAIAYCMGLIVGEGSFTGSGEAPWLAVKLHARDELPLLELKRVFGGRINGPYHHDGRHFRVWMLRCRQLAEALEFFDRWLPPSHKREQYAIWRERWAEYFAQKYWDAFPPET
jgi:hypothetical protein